MDKARYFSANLEIKKEKKKISWELLNKGIGNLRIKMLKSLTTLDLEQESHFLFFFAFR